MIEYRPIRSDDASAVETLFLESFTRSEGEPEGKLIGNLVHELIRQTDPQTLRPLPVRQRIRQPRLLVSSHNIPKLGKMNHG